MKILFVNPVGVIGGAERGLLTIIAYLVNSQPHLELHLITATNGALVEQAEKLGVRVNVIELPEAVNQLGDSGIVGQNRAIALLTLLLKLMQISPKLSKYLQKFRGAIKEINPDLIHSNGIKTHLIIALMRLPKIPVIWHIQDFYGSRPLVARILKWISPSATLGIAISQAVAKDVRSKIPNLPIKVVYLSIDTNYFCPHFTSSQSHTFRVGLVATFARWKGHHIFLEAAAHIVKTRPDIKVQFWIVGGAIYKTQGSQFSQQELQDKAISLEIADRVEFLGFQPDITEIYRQLDIVVHASTQPEPFGLAIVEAMACGKPVIVSQAGGAMELFTHNYNAVGVPPGKAIALATAILDLLDHPEKCQTMAKNARQTVIQRFNQTNLGGQIWQIYQGLLIGNREQGTGNINFWLNRFFRNADRRFPK